MLSAPLEEYSTLICLCDLYRRMHWLKWHFCRCLQLAYAVSYNQETWITSCLFWPCSYACPLACSFTWVELHIHSSHCATQRHYAFSLMRHIINMICYTFFSITVSLTEFVLLFSALCFVSGNFLLDGILCPARITLYSTVPLCSLINLPNTS